MKGKAKAGYVLARVFEVIGWLGVAMMVISFLVGIIDPEVISVMSDTDAAGAKVSVPMVPGSLGRLDITGPDGTLHQGLYLLYTAAGAAELALTALVFRRIWQIIKLSWASTPFQQPVVKKVKQIGWLFIAAPLVTVAVSLVAEPDIRLRCEAGGRRGGAAVMKKIVLRLDRMMVERHMSLNELAERVGISNVNLSKIKNNRVTAVRFSTLAAICEALDCTPGDILELEDE